MSDIFGRFGDSAAGLLRDAAQKVPLAAIIDAHVKTP
jgi:hypothetical protein